MRIKITANGKDSELFSNTIEASLRFPDFVTCLALSMTILNVSCQKEKKKKRCFNGNLSMETTEEIVEKFLG